MESNPTAAPANNPDVIRVCVNRMFIPFSEPLTFQKPVLAAVNR
jgi:hypothetical protein